MNPTLTTYFLQILKGQQSNAQVLIFVLNSLRDAEFFIWEQGKKNRLLHDKKYDLVFFLMYNSLLRSFHKMKDIIYPFRRHSNFRFKYLHC